MKEIEYGASIAANNITDLSTNAIAHLKRVGLHYKSDKGDVVMHPRMELILTNPYQRSLNIKGRKSNIFQLIAETLWIVSGSDRVTGYLSEFLPRAVNYSDDGTTWRGGYGPRLFPQLNELSKMISDSPMTRQAYISIFDSERDLPSGLKKHYGLDSTKDVPCNVGMNFWVMPEANTLNLEVIQRSGDIFWGTGSINLFEFSFILELILVDVNWQNKALMQPELEMGSYCQRVTNLHYYPNNIGGQVEDIVDYHYEHRGDTQASRSDDKIRISPTRIGYVQEFCKDFIEYCEVMLIPNGSPKPETSLTVEKLCTRWNIEIDTKNTIYVYAKLVEQYLTFKHTGKDADHFEGLFEHCPSLLEAVLDCKYTKFSI